MLDNVKYKQNVYYKNLYDALLKAYTKERDKLYSTITNGNCKDNETAWNNSYYNFLASLDFCENLTMWGDDYVYFELENAFDKIRQCSVDRIAMGEKLLKVAK